MYESTCTICEKKEESLEKGSNETKSSKNGLSSHGGVYVVRSARSIFERAGEHKEAADKMEDDSHMVKHWILEHPQEKEQPAFKFKIVASF